jgi:hypothetical protein
MSYSSSWFVPLGKANPAHYFQFTNLSLLYMIYPSYYGQKFKYIRGAEAYWHHVHTNCSRSGKEGIIVTTLTFIGVAFSKYLSAHDYASTLVYRRWFKRNALTT